MNRDIVRQLTPANTLIGVGSSRTSPRDTQVDCASAASARLGLLPRLLPRSGDRLWTALLIVQSILLVLYAVYHLRRLDLAGLWALPVWSCAVACVGPTGPGTPADALSALVLLVAAALGAWRMTIFTQPVRFERPLVFAVWYVGLLAVPAAVIGGVAYVVGASFLRPPIGPLLASLPALALSVASLRDSPRVNRTRHQSESTWPRLRGAGLPELIAALAVIGLVASAT